MFICYELNYNKINKLIYILYVTEFLKQITLFYIYIEWGWVSSAHPRIRAKFRKDIESTYKPFFKGPGPHKIYS